MSINRIHPISPNDFHFQCETASSTGVHVLCATHNIESIENIHSSQSIQSIQSIWITSQMYHEVHSSPYFRTLPPATRPTQPLTFELQFKYITDFLQFVSAVRIRSTVTIKNHDNCQQSAIQIPLAIYEDLRPTLHPISETSEFTPAETEHSEQQILIPSLSSLPDNEFQELKQILVEVALAKEQFVQYIKDNRTIILEELSDLNDELKDQLISLRDSSPNMHIIIQLPQDATVPKEVVSQLCELMKSVSADEQQNQVPLIFAAKDEGHQLTKMDKGNFPTAQFFSSLDKAILGMDDALCIVSINRSFYWPFHPESATK